MRMGLIILFAGVLIISVLAVILACIRTGKPIRTLLSSTFIGILSLGVVNLAGNFTGVYLAVNSYSLAVAGVGGAPGVVTLLIINTVFGL